jgi:arsenate reductase-like glutaredoxin family protein
MDTPSIQVFGLEKDQSTRAALRFFKERRAAVSFVDLRRRSIAPAELRRFIARLGALTCADTEGRAWRDAGLGYLQMTDDELAAKLLADARLLRLPLIRCGNDVTAGRAEQTWKSWFNPGRNGSFSERPRLANATQDRCLRSAARRRSPPRSDRRP